MSYRRQQEESRLRNIATTNATRLRNTAEQFTATEKALNEGRHRHNLKAVNLPIMSEVMRQGDNSLSSEDVTPIEFYNFATITDVGKHKVTATATMFNADDTPAAFVTRCVVVTLDTSGEITAEEQNHACTKYSSDRVSIVGDTGMFLLSECVGVFRFKVQVKMIRDLPEYVVQRFTGVHKFVAVYDGGSLPALKNMTILRAVNRNIRLGNPNYAVNKEQANKVLILSELPVRPVFWKRKEEDTYGFNEHEYTSHFTKPEPVVVLDTATLEKNTLYEVQGVSSYTTEDGGVMYNKHYAKFYTAPEGTVGETPTTTFHFSKLNHPATHDRVSGYMALKDGKLLLSVASISCVCRWNLTYEKCI